MRGIVPILIGVACAFMHARMALAQTPSSSAFRPGPNRVTFSSEGEKMVGNLFLPAGYKLGDRLPAVVVVGSMASVKEQMAGLYATRLAEQGFAALAFDYRFFGESGGQPRQYESPDNHIADIRSAAAFLRSLPVVAPGQVAGLGVCTGAGYMAVAAAAPDSPIKSYAGVALHIPTAETHRQLYGGEEGIRAKREAGTKARSRYEQTGEAEYLLAYSNKPGDPTASHSGPMEYYFDAARGHILPWTNRFAVMSWPEWLDFDPMRVAEKILVPSLIIHSDNSSLPKSARTFYERIKGKKSLIWTKDNHFDFYDREPQVTKAVQSIATHFKDTLPGAQ